MGAYLHRSGVSRADLASMPVTAANFAAGRAQVGILPSPQRHHQLTRWGPLSSAQHGIERGVPASFQFRVAPSPGVSHRRHHAVATECVGATLRVT